MIQQSHSLTYTQIKLTWKDTCTPTFTAALFTITKTWKQPMLSCSIVSDSSRPHGLQTTRLLRPWDFSGKNTGVGCISFSRASSRHRDQSAISCISCIAGGFFTTEPPGKSISKTWKQPKCLSIDGTVVKNLPLMQETHKRCTFNLWVGKIPWRMKWQPTPVFLPEKSHGQRSLVGYSSWGHKESDMTEQLNNNL